MKTLAILLCFLGAFNQAYAYDVFENGEVISIKNMSGVTIIVNDDYELEEGSYYTTVGENLKLSKKKTSCLGAMNDWR